MKMTTRRIIDENIKVNPTIIAATTMTRNRRPTTSFRKTKIMTIITIMISVLIPYCYSDADESSKDDSSVKTTVRALFLRMNILTDRTNTTMERGQ